ncbi:MAG: hypothetical protein H6807_14665 [Planctomycetes bacterium]|nr:hypothetical protein [Planctomycetota bacterium]
MYARFGALLVVGTLALAACTTQYHYSRDGQIRFEEARDRYQDVSLHKAFHDGALVGWVDTKLILDGDSNDYNDRYEMFVLDNRGNALGFVTDRGQAFRYRAHGEPEMVGEHDELERSVRSIFGFTGGDFRLEKQIAQR